MTTTDKKEAPGAAVIVTDTASRNLRKQRAQEEADALKAWEAAGGKGDRPPTPNLDAIPTAKAGSSKAKAKAPARPRQTVVFTIDGKPKVLKGRTYTLGYLAQSLYGTGTGDTDRLRAELKRQGVADPETSTWHAEVDGHKVGAVTPAAAEKLAAKGEPAKPARKPAARKGPAKAKPKAAAKKAPARRGKAA